MVDGFPTTIHRPTLENLLFPFFIFFCLPCRLKKHCIFHNTFTTRETKANRWLPKTWKEQFDLNALNKYLVLRVEKKCVCIHLQAEHTLLHPQNINPILYRLPLAFRLSINHRSATNCTISYKAAQYGHATLTFMSNSSIIPIILKSHWKP